MSKSVLGKVFKAAAGLVVVAGAAAAAGVAYGLKKWSEDEDSRDIKMTTGRPTGLHISKTDDGKYLVDTKYEWTDEDYDDDDEEDGAIIIDLSKHAEENTEAAEENAEETAEETAEAVAEAAEAAAAEETEETAEAVKEETAPAAETAPADDSCGCCGTPE